MNVIKEIERINAMELKSGIVGGIGKGSWHDKYKESAWVYIGGMSLDLSEGDVVCVMSQWGEIEDINLVRDKATNKSLGYAFVKYEDQRSTILAVDNFNGIKLLGRTLRCDHVDKYKLSKDVRQREEDLLENDPEAEPDIGPGHAYKDQEMANDFSISDGTDVWEAPKSRQQPSIHSLFILLPLRFSLDFSYYLLSVTYQVSFIVSYYEKLSVISNKFNLFTPDCR
jgi:RNA-binding motif X-linked protein 2